MSLRKIDPPQEGPKDFLLGNIYIYTLEGPTDFL